MIPTTEPIPLPTDRSDSARLYLQSHGLSPINPPIRSSDYALLLSDPFRYYLTRRLGLVPPLQYSVALNRGTWFHTCAQAAQTAEPAAFLSEAFAARTAELNAVFESLRILPAAASSILTRERADFETASAWFTAAMAVALPSGKTLSQRLGAPLQSVASELTLTYNLLLNGKTHRLVCTVDQLLYDARTNLLFIVDYKTCSEPPSVRLAKCTREMQTWLYLYIVNALLEGGELQPLLKIPSSCILGGIHHVAIQKPTIRIGMNDRPFTTREFTPKTGPNKGVTRLEREYHGEPTLANYLARCTAWYAGQGEFSHLADRELPVNISTISSSLLKSPLTEKDLFTRIEFIASHAGRTANPDLFLDNPAGIYDGRSTKPSLYAPLYLNAVRDWPAIIAEQRFIVDHRDDPSDSPLQSED